MLQVQMDNQGFAGLAPKPTWAAASSEICVVSGSSIDEEGLSLVTTHRAQWLSPKSTHI